MRPFIKERLSDNEEAWSAVAVLQMWRSVRQLSQNLPRAIRLYDALLQGDVSFLRSYFPGLAIGAGIGTPLPTSFQLKAAVVTQVKRTDEEDLEDAGSLLGGLFG